MKIALYTLGCKLNQFETVGMEEALRAAGHEIVPWDADADVCIINTCTVTAKTDRKSRRIIRHAARSEAKRIVVATGCYAQRAPEILAAIPEVDIVAGNPDKANIAELLDKVRAGRSERVVVGDAARNLRDLPLTGFGELTRAFVKIQNGCNDRCAYCIIPLVRGPSRSVPAAETLDTVSRLVSEGFREIVLTGIHLGAYGRDLKPETTLVELAGAILKQTAFQSGKARLRLSSIEPIEFTDGLINLIAENRSICRHLHIPLQSGSGAVLKRMNRRYQPERYAALVRELAERVPDINIGADVIVGFPGETDSEFAETERFIRELPLGYLHVFNYSVRPGTAAADMPDHIAPETRKKRSKILLGISAEKKRKIRERFLEKRLPCLVLQARDEKTGLIRCLSDNYIEVLIEGPDEWMNRILEVRPERISEERVFGAVAEIT